MRGAVIGLFLAGAVLPAAVPTPGHPQEEDGTEGTRIERPTAPVSRPAPPRWAGGGRAATVSGEPHTAGERATGLPPFAGIDTTPSLLRSAVEGLLPHSFRSEVLVLGTTHLSAYADGFEPGLLDALVAALDEWGPDAVGVEREPPGVYRGIGAEEEPAVARAVQQELGVTLERAVAVSDSLLEAASAGELSPDHRLALVRYLLAATRLPTATLHWTRIPADVRSRAGLPDEARQALEARAGGVANEIYSIGVRLAREQGLTQVHNIDDHTSERVYDLERAAAEGGLREHLASHPGYDSVQAYIRESKRRVTEAIGDGDLLPFYRWKNDAETVTRDVRLQWGIFLELAGQTPMAQKRLAHWEIRNLKMVEHVRAMTLHHPGERILVVVGAGHKAFFDAYLDAMLDVEIVQLGEVLEASGPAFGPPGERR